MIFAHLKVWTTLMVHAEAVTRHADAALSAKLTGVIADLDSSDLLHLRDLFHLRDNLAHAHKFAGRTAEVIRLLEESLKLRLAAFGPEHLAAFVDTDKFAKAYWSAGRLDLSVPMFEEMYRARVAELGPKHPDTLATQVNLGVNYNDAGRIPEAIALLESGAGMAEAAPGPEHHHTLFARDSLAMAYKAPAAPPRRPGFSRECSIPNIATRSRPAAAPPWPTGGPVGSTSPYPCSRRCIGNGWPSSGPNIL